MCREVVKVQNQNIHNPAQPSSVPGLGSFLSAQSLNRLSGIYPKKTWEGSTEHNDSEGIDRCFKLQ
jgi:hypothetical protein